MIENVRQLLRLARLPHKGRIGRFDIPTLQLKRLRHLLQIVGRDVPYYRDLFENLGFDPAEIRSVEDIEGIPASSKSSMQAVPENVVLSRYHLPENLILRNTTGSTGRPFKIYRSWSEERILGAYRRRVLQFYGMTRRDTHVDLEELEPRDPNDNRTMHELFMRTGFFRQYRVDATLQPFELLEQLEKLQPDVITGYSASTALLAQWMLDHHVDSVRPRFVAVHSEVLTVRMRQQIEQAFQCPVHMLYDANECNVIAFECPQTGLLHVCDDSVLVEVVRDGRVVNPGEEGEVLITSLHSFVHPFIRFKIGDLATRGPERCPCGAPFSTIKEVHGRMFDYFPLKDGRMLHPYRILELLGDKNSWIRQYRLVQEEIDLVRLYVVPTSEDGAASAEGIQARVSEELGDAARFEVSLVDRLEHDGRAKFRVCISRVASEYGKEQAGEDSSHDQHG